MLTNPTPEPDRSNLTSLALPPDQGVGRTDLADLRSPTSVPEPNPAFPAATADPPTGATAPCEPGALLPGVTSPLPAPGFDAQILRLKSDVPEIGVLGVAEQLTDSEYINLLTYEEVVAMANTSWFEAGRALAQIRDQALWRGAYTGFDEYCARRWQFGRTMRHYLIGAASVCDTLKSVPDLPAPEFESQVRALVPLDSEKRIEAWRRATQRAGPRKITGAMVRAAARAVQASAQPNTVQSERRQELLARRRQVRDLMSELLEWIMGHRPYEELIQKAAALEAQVRFFFPPPRKR